SPVVAAAARAAARASFLLVVVVVIVATSEPDLLPDRVHAALDRALGLRLGQLFGPALEEVGDALRVVGCAQIEPVHGLGEAQVGVDARDDDAQVDGQE